MLRRGLPAAVLVAASWIGLDAAQQNAPPEPGAASGAEAGEGEETEAQVGPPEPPPDVLEIGDGLYVLPYCGNAVARVTPLGVVLAGHRLAEYRAEITRLLATVTDRRIAYELATHPGEDAGATPIAPGARSIAPGARSIAPGARSIAPGARSIAPGRGGARASPGAGAAAPDILFTARLSLFLEDARIALHHVGGGPADGAAVVVFPDRGAVHAGRLVVDGAPFIDFASGGSAAGWIESLDALLALAFETVIPGEGGPVLQRSDALAFRDRLVTLRTRVEQLVRRGVGKEDVADHLQTADLGWLLGLAGDFVRETLPGLYDEVAGGR